MIYPKYRYLHTIKSRRESETLQYLSRLEKTLYNQFYQSQGRNLCKILNFSGKASDVRTITEIVTIVIFCRDCQIWGVLGTTEIAYFNMLDLKGLLIGAKSRISRAKRCRNARGMHETLHRTRSGSSKKRMWRA